MSSKRPTALTLFEESLDVPTAERSRWLAERSAGDPELLAELLGLFEADQSDADLTLPYAAPPLADRRAERVGAFELVEEIGAGGMGRVFRARRADGAFDQEVAVKLFEGSGRSAVGLQRFRQERQILASFEHPGIARLIDGGQAPDGTPYVVMELVRGRAITSYCDAGALPLAARLQLFARVCDAVEAAHRLGVVHRDLKPANVLVTDDGDPKVIDFGIAKVLEPDRRRPDLQLETATRMGAMTPEYASPEQVLQRPVGPASDVYSLGVMLYELLTGARPYHLAALTASQIERTVCESVPADPSRLAARMRAAPPRGLAEPRSLARTLKGDLDRVVMTALHKDPEQRYRSAGQLGQDIERYLTGHAVVARGASRAYRFGKLVRRNRGLAVATTAVFVVLIAGLVAVAFQARTARLEAEKAGAVQDFLVEMIGRADPIHSGSEVPTLADAVLAVTPEVGRRFDGKPDVEADVRYALGFALAGLGETGPARGELQRAADLYREHGTAVDRARTLLGLAGVAWDEGELEEARGLHEQALGALRGLSGREADQGRLDVLSSYAGLLGHLNDYEAGVETAERAFELVERLGDVSLRGQASLWNNLATNLDGLERYDESIPAFEKSIELHREAGAPNPEMAIVLANLGMTHELVGRIDRALENLDESLAMQEALLGPEHPQTVLQMYNLGSMRLNAGDLEGAVATLSEAVRRAGAAYSEDHLYTGRFHFRLAVALERSGELASAREHAERADAVYRTVGDEVPAGWTQAMRELRLRLDG